MHVVTTQSVTYGKPVLDEKTGKPLRQKIKFSNREIETDVIDHVRLKANAVVELDDAHAKELIKAGLARQHVPELDDAPTDIEDTSLN